MMIDIVPQATKSRPIPSRQVVPLRVPSTGMLAPDTAISVTARERSIEWLPIPLEQPVDRAERLLEQAVEHAHAEAERFPHSAMSQANLAQALWQANRVDEAARMCEIALQLDPSNYSALLLLAKAREAEGRSDESRLIYSRLHDSRPSDPLPLLGLADSDMRRGRFDSAIAHLRTLLTKNPRDTSGLLYLGMALLRQHKGHEAIAVLRTATRTDQRSPVLRHALALAYWSNNSFRRAETEFRAALHVLPSHVPAIRSFAQFLITADRTSEAAALLNSYLAHYPDNASVRELLSRALFEAKDFAHAAEHLRIASRLLDSQGGLSDRARVANNIAVCYSRVRRWDAALPWYRRAVELEPHQREARLNLARLLLETGEYRSALQVLSSFQVSQGAAEAGYLTAVALNNLEEYGRATELLRSVVRFTDSPPAAFGLLGTLLADEAKLFDQSIEVLQAAVEKFPKDPIVANNLAYALLLADRVDEARDILSKYPESATNDLFLRATWGLLHLRSGEIEAGIAGYRAAQYLAKAIGRHDLANLAKQKMHLELARYYLRAGDVQRARSEAKRGLGVKGKASFERDLRELMEQAGRSGH